MRIWLLAAAMLLAAPVVHAQDDGPYTLTKVTPDITMISGNGVFTGGNVTLLTGKDYRVLIDDGLTSYATRLLDTVAKLAGGPIDFVINTHVHGDHVGANAALNATGALILAQDKVRERLLPDAKDAGGPAGLPVITFPDSMSFHVNGHDAQVFYVPAAHTDGDTVVWFKDINVIEAGDVLFNGLFPFIDLESGGSLAGYLDAQRRVLELSDDDTLIIPGHGPLAHKADLMAAHEMLVDARARVKRLVDEGKTLDEVLAADPLAAYTGKWSWDFITTERMTTTIYRSLSSTPNK
jgi:cyclase